MTTLKKMSNKNKQTQKDIGVLSEALVLLRDIFTNETQDILFAVVCDLDAGDRQTANISSFVDLFDLKDMLFTKRSREHINGNTYVLLPMNSLLAQDVAIGFECNYANRESALRAVRKAGGKVLKV